MRCYYPVGLNCVTPRAGLFVSLGHDLLDIRQPIPFASIQFPGLREEGIAGAAGHDLGDWGGQRLGLPIAD